VPSDEHAVPTPLAIVNVKQRTRRPTEHTPLNENCRKSTAEGLLRLIYQIRDISLRHG